MLRLRGSNTDDMSEWSMVTIAARGHRFRRRRHIVELFDPDKALFRQRGMRGNGQGVDRWINVSFPVDSLIVAS